MASALSRERFADADLYGGAGSAGAPPLPAPPNIKHLLKKN